jgi:hypothetical protein
MSAEEAGVEPSATPSSEPAPATSKAFDLEKQKGEIVRMRPGRRALRAVPRVNR